MKDSELLRKAKGVLERSDGSMSNGVCLSITIAAGSYHDPQAKSLKRWVESMLGPNSVFLQDWLLKNRHITKAQLQCMSESFELMQKLKQTRLNWLDWMIEYCEKEEADAGKAEANGQGGA